MNTITRENLSKEIQEQILYTLHESNGWKQLVQKLEKAQRNMNFVAMAQARAMMKKVEDDVFKTYCENLTEETVAIHEILRDMPEQEAEKLREYLDGIYFLLDVLDSVILDTDALLRANCPDCSLTFYDKIKELRKEIQFHIETVLRKSDEKNTELICNYADDITGYVLAKTKEFLREEKQINGLSHDKQQ